MLTSLFQALISQLSPLDMPVYLVDCVPDGTAFPYVAAEVQPSLTGQDSGALTLTLWSHCDAANAERLAQADSLLSLLPARGVRLSLEEGALLLRLKEPAVCVQDSAARGLRTVWQLTFIPSV